MKTLKETLLDENFDTQEMPSTDFPGVDELLSILEKYDWKPNGNSDKEGITAWAYYRLVHKYTNETFYADLMDWIYEFGKKSRAPFYNLPVSEGKNNFKINLFDYGRARLRRSILVTVRRGEEELSVEQPAPKGKCHWYVHELAGELIQWFVKNESSK